MANGTKWIEEMRAESSVCVGIYTWFSAVAAQQHISLSPMIPFNAVVRRTIDTEPSEDGDGHGHWATWKKSLHHAYTHNLIDFMIMFHSFSVLVVVRGSYSLFGVNFFFSFSYNKGQTHNIFIDIIYFGDEFFASCSPVGRFIGASATTNTCTNPKIGIVLCIHCTFHSISVIFFRAQLHTAQSSVSMFSICI